MPFGIDALEADRQDVAERAGQHRVHLRFAAALAQLLALAGHVGDHQAAAVQHADEVVQLLDRDLLRAESGARTRP